MESSVVEGLHSKGGNWQGEGSEEMVQGIGHTEICLYSQRPVCLFPKEEARNVPELVKSFVRLHFT